MTLPGPALYRLIYVSKVSQLGMASFQTNLDTIVAKSERANRDRDITGALISHKGWFVQALEGNEHVVLELYSKIAADPRHEAVQQVSFHQVTDRLFGAWGMRAGHPPIAAMDRALNLDVLSSSVLLSLLHRSVLDGRTEESRVDALRSLQVLDTLPEQQFEDIVLVARTLSGADAALISLVDADRQWFKAKVGVDICQTNREDSFCAYAIKEPVVLWVEDARKDARFFDNALVTAGPLIRFYAGAPLAVSGQIVGTLCVLGDQPKPYDGAISAALDALARCVSARLEARREEQMAASLLSSAADAIICVDDSGKITFWNPAAEDMFGYRAAEVLGGPMDMIVPPRRRAAYNAAFLQARQSGTSSPLRNSISVPALRRDGTEFPIDVAMAVWGEGGQFGAGVIIRDCSERRAAEKALAAAKDAAEAANIAKSAFLANMSHEIRTPLNGVIGVTELLAASGLTPQQSEMAELIRSSGEQLHGILGDILDIARIEAGEFALSLEPIFLPQLLRSTVDLCGLKAREKNLSLDLIIDQSADAFVQADPVRLKQILTNLLSNAVKFTTTGSVTLSAERTPDNLVKLTVKDTGVGFDPALKDLIFGRFQQADGSITRRFGGTGLGLAICRQLAELMGGRIDCDSEPGEGSAFQVLLPLQLTSPTFEVSSEPEEDWAASPGRPLSILLADDHPTNRRVVELILAGLEAQIVSVDDGAKALDAYRHQTFDLVLMDMMMPVMDGLAATKAIRAHELECHRSRTPILMLTANALPEHIAAAVVAGADQHVSKPVTANQLIEAISKALDEDERNSLEDSELRLAAN